MIWGDKGFLRGMDRFYWGVEKEVISLFLIFLRKGRNVNKRMYIFFFVFILEENCF